jgi:hypothetical protein
MRTAPPLTRSLALAPSSVEERVPGVAFAELGADKVAGAVARSALSSVTDKGKMKDTGLREPFQFMQEA